MTLDEARPTWPRRWHWFGLVAALVLWPPAPVAAHESREILSAKYVLRVGFSEEPAYQGLLNGLELTICEAKCTTNQETGQLTTGVVGAFETVKAEVIYGGQTMPLPLVAVPRQPGRYQARFVPTRAGDYTFHIWGKLGDGAFDERFTSSPTTFDSVQPAAAVQFPDKLGYPVGAPAAPVAAPVLTSPAVTPPATPRPVVPATSAPATIPTPAPPAATASTGLTEFQVLRAIQRDQQQQLEAATTSVATANALAIGGLAAGALGLGVALLALLFARQHGPDRPDAEPAEEAEP